MNTLKNKTAITTGAGRGIGREIAVEFAAAGANVVLASRSQEQLEAVLPVMLERGGRIINMIGGGTGSPFPNGSGYGSSKAALMRFTETLDKDVYEKGIPVFAMGPGLVRTAMTELQLTTEAGRRWMKNIRQAFDNGVDVPPTLAVRSAVTLATGRCDELHGRAFQSRDGIEKLLAVKQKIIEQDLLTLRVRGVE